MHCCRSCTQQKISASGFKSQQIISLRKVFRRTTRLVTRLTAFLVWMNTVPGPVNLHTRPSPDAKPEMMPPDATRSITYFVFQATRWPLSTMYFSCSTSCRGLLSAYCTRTEIFVERDE